MIESSSSDTDSDAHSDKGRRRDKSPVVKRPRTADEGDKAAELSIAELEEQRRKLEESLKAIEKPANGEASRRHRSKVF